MNMVYPFITFLASVLVWMMVGGLFVLWFVDGRIKKEQVIHASVSILIAWSVNYLLKIVFHTPRPYVLNELPTLTLSLPRDWAFPSGHTAMAFAMATSIWLHDKRVGSVYMVGAFLVGAGRVLGNVHFPVDILGGAIVGSAVAFIIEKRHLFRITPKSPNRKG